jgi:hypothetical protein
MSPERTWLLAITRGFRGLRNRELRDFDELCRPSELGQVCFREIGVLHDGANVRNRQPRDAIKHGPQSVHSANPTPSAISQNLYAFSSCDIPDGPSITPMG